MKTMFKKRGAIVIDKDRCKGCGLCSAACPMNIMSRTKTEVNAKGYLYSYQTQPELCVGCACCATVCPDSCISVYKVNSSVEELASAVTQLAKIKLRGRTTFVR